MCLVIFLPRQDTCNVFTVLLLGHLGFCSRARCRASFTAVHRLVCFVAPSDTAVPGVLPAAAAAAENARWPLSKQRRQRCTRPAIKCGSPHQPVPSGKHSGDTELVLFINKYTAGCRLGPSFGHLASDQLSTLAEASGPGGPGRCLRSSERLATLSGLPPSRPPERVGTVSELIISPGRRCI